MHLLLVTIHAHPSPQAVPLAAASLKAYLDSRQGATAPVAVSCCEFYSGTPIAEISAAILALYPTMVGLPLYLWNRQESAALTATLRQLAPELLIIGGGPEATADPVRVLAEAPYDLLVVGEGELTLAELLERLVAGLPLDDLAGIARREGAQTIVSRRPPIADLAILPSPYLSGLLDDHITTGVVWQLSRGCSFGCDFCFDGMGDSRVRRYPLARLEAELAYLVERGVAQVFVLDSTFNQDKKRAKSLLRLIARLAPQVHFHFEVRHELLDAEQARLFAGLTCSLQIGLQSADPLVAQNVGRKLDRDDFVSKIMLLNETGVVFGFDLIYGLPGDTLDTFRAGLDFALSLYPNHLDIFPLAVLPGTRIASRAESLGLQHLPTPPYTLLASPTFPAVDMALARQLGRASDIFYSRGKGVAWCNGILAALSLTPVALLERFSLWLVEKMGDEFEEADFSDADIWQLQRQFLTLLFKERKEERLLPLALDFVDYHYYYAATVMAVSPLPVQGGADPLSRPLLLADSALLASFSYEILELLESGEPDLPHCYATLQPTGSQGVIYPYGGEVLTESLAEAYFLLLQRLDGVTLAAKLAKELSLPGDEAEEFLVFALEQGIVVPA